MVLQSFLIFIGSILGCSIALAVIVKNLSQGFAANGKKPMLYGSVSGILTSISAYLALYISENAFTVFWILGVVFLIFGIIHILFVRNRYFYTNKADSNKLLFSEFLFGLSVVLFTIAVFCSLQYFLKQEKSFLFYPLLMSSLLFFVPLLIFHAYQAAFAIPATVFPTWSYPLHQPIELPDEDTRDKIVVIGFEMAKRESDLQKTYFRAKGPETMKLGEFFYHFINEYNERYSETRIEITAKSGAGSQWWFRKKPKWHEAHKIYDPELSIRENRIKENTVVICERAVKVQAATTNLHLA